MRVFKNKWFNRWARSEGISDDMLHKAATEVVAGKVEADLGGCLFKKRIARASGGKSGGYRTILGFKKNGRIIFLYAFAKSQRSNISSKEEAALSLAARTFLSATESDVERAIAEGLVWEVKRNV